MGNCLSMNEVYPDEVVESMRKMKRHEARQHEPYRALRRRRRPIYLNQSEARITIRSI